MRPLPLLLALALSSTIAACSGEPELSPDAGPTVRRDAGAADGGEVVIVQPDGSVPKPYDGGWEGPTVVYGHSADTLYRVDATTKAVSVIAGFSGCSSVIDLAIDKDGNIIGTTFNGLWKINAATAQCTLIKTGSYPNSLSFVPAGTLDANVEALVGYNGATYIRIDPTTGSVTNIGALTGGFISSGDIVSVKGGGTYLTVKSNGCADCLFKVDPKTGDMLQNLGAVGYGSVFGLAFWAGTIYGFTDAGDIFSLDLKTMKTTKLTIPNPPAGLSFWGAGSTTSAPVQPN